MDASSSQEPTSYWCRFRDGQIEALYATRPPDPWAAEFVEIATDDRRVQTRLRGGWGVWDRRVLHLTAESFESFERLVRFFSRGPTRAAFRGQADFGWRLETGLERECQSRHWSESSCTSGVLEQREHRIVLEARRRLHGYLSERPKDDDRLSWLALLRHFGVPTRLLDVTWSPFVAAYFATRDRTKRDADAAVWVFMSDASMRGSIRGDAMRR